MIVFGSFATWLVYFAMQQPLEHRAEWLQLAISVVTLITLIGLILFYAKEFQTFSKRPKIELGLARNSEYHNINVSNLATSDEHYPRSNIVPISYLVIKNVGNVALQNIKLQILYDGKFPQKSKLFYEALNSPIKKFKHHNYSVTFYSNDWYIGIGDSQVIELKYWFEDKYKDMPTGEHKLNCSFWCNHIEEPITQELKIHFQNNRSQEL